MTQFSDAKFSRRQLLGFSLATALATSHRPAAAESAQSVLAKEIERQADAIIKNAMTESKVPGLLLGIVKNGKTVIRKGYGYSDRERKTSAKPEDLFHGGSDGKMFTATAISLLARDGKLQFQDPISLHLRGTPAKWQGITVDMLMRHRSGIQEYFGNPLFDIKKEVTDAEAIKQFGSWPLNFKPGTQFSYTNTGYALLGFIITAVTGEDYAKFLERRIFKPAKMLRARVNDSSIPVAGRAIGYTADVEIFQREGRIVVNRAGKASRSVNRFGDGSILFSLDDFIAWRDAVARNRILSVSEQRKIETSPPFADKSISIGNYGAGWYTQSIRGERLIAHAGSWLGFSSWFGFLPEEDLSIIILCNAEYWDIEATFAKLAWPVQQTARALCSNH
jgi:CubicO group peptidase (beta-lactamase class C family)